LTDAIVSGADLRGANLTGAKLEAGKVEGICFDDQTQWPNGFTPPSNPNGCER
jgi:uncharacterized protein YjbI with pentapeptide repeats